MTHHRHNFNKRTRAPKPVRQKINGMPFGVDLKSLGLFYESMAMMIKSGVSLKIALEKFRDHPKLGDSISRISDSISAGGSLSEAISRESGVFSEIDAVRIAQAEDSGTLDRVLPELHQQVTQTINYRRGTLRMLGMPLFYAIAGMVLLRLPGVFSGETTMLSYVLPLIIVALVGVTVILISQMSQPFRWLKNNDAFCGTLAGIPVVRGVLQAQSRYGFADSMYLTFHSGMSLNLGIPLGLRRILVPAWRQQMANALGQVIHGAGLAATITATRFFEDRDNVRITSGEVAGKLDEAFAAIAFESRMAAQKKMQMIARAVAGIVGLIVLIAVGYSIIKGYTDRLDMIDQIN